MRTLKNLCCASKRSLVLYSWVIQSQLFCIFQQNLLFVLLCKRASDAVVTKIKLLRLKSNKMPMKIITSRVYTRVVKFCQSILEEETLG